MLAAGPEVMARTLAGSKPREARKFVMLTAVWNGAKPWSETTMMSESGRPRPSVPMAWMMRSTAPLAAWYAARR